MKTIIGYIIAILFLIGAIIGDIKSVNSMNADIKSTQEYFYVINDNN